MYILYLFQNKQWFMFGHPFYMRLFVIFAFIPETNRQWCTITQNGIAIRWIIPIQKNIAESVIAFSRSWTFWYVSNLLKICYTHPSPFLRLQWKCSCIFKVKLSLCLTKHKAMKTYWGGGIAPRILWPQH